MTRGLAATKGTDRDFTLLLAGSSVSMVGSRVTTIAYPMLALYLTGSPVAAGWVACAATAPSIVCYMPAGALMDILDPKRVLMLSESGRGIAIAWVVAMVAMGWRSLPLLIVAAIVEEVLEVFSTLAERRYVGSLVERDQAAAALGRVEGRTHLAVLVGRPLGGLLFELKPIAPFLFDVFTFIGSVGALLRIKRRRTTEQPAFSAPASEISIRARAVRAVTRLDQPPDWHIRSDIREGMRWLRRNRFARTAMTLLAGTTLISQALIMVFIAEAHAQKLPSVTVGLVLAMSGFGGAFGSALASRLRILFKDFWLQVQLSVWSVAFIILALPGGQSPAHMAATLVVLGFMGAMSNIEFDTYLIKHVPQNMLARVTSIGCLVSFTALAAGPLIGGSLFELYGTKDGVQDTVRWLMVTTIFLAACSIFAPSMRARGNYDTADAQRQAAHEASALDRIIGRQLSGLASCLAAMNAVARDDRAPGLPAAPIAPIAPIADSGMRAPETVSSGQIST